MNLSKHQKSAVLFMLMIALALTLCACGAKSQPAKTKKSAKPKTVTNHQKAVKYVKNMSLDEKIAQLLLVRYPDNAAAVAKQYNFGGYLLFTKDFAGKDTAQVQAMTQAVQANAKVPYLIAVDEEGGAVNRVSTNPKLVASPFKSSQTLYREGGFDAIKADTVNKSNILANLGINLNLAPVVDVCQSASDYMYSRSLGQNAAVTSEYAKTVIEASRKSGVSYTLKHFPGYGNNVNTHTQTSVDKRTLDDIKTNDLPPFRAGIKAGAEAVLISHNIVTSVDSDNPASLSPKVHDLLRDDLKFKGVIMTDALDMDAVSRIPGVSAKAVQAGNDLLITTNYEQSIADIKNAVAQKTISEDAIDEHATRVIEWKYDKGLLK